MEISKLTITPIIPGTKGFTTKNPSAQTAQTMITERMLHWQEADSVKEFKKLPKWIKSLVNPDSYIKIRKIYK